MLIFFKVSNVFPSKYYIETIFIHFLSLETKMYQNFEQK